MPDRLYQQNHCGMYRSDDGGRTWQSIEKGLPSSFGFPAAAHPRDPDTLYLVPLNGDIAGPLHAGREGRRLAHARRRRTAGGHARGPAAGERLSSACCARRWRPTGWSRPASISAPVPARSSPAPTRAKAGPAIADHLPTISSVETLVRRRLTMPSAPAPPSADRARRKRVVGAACRAAGRPVSRRAAAAGDRGRDGRAT